MEERGVEGRGREAYKDLSPNLRAGAPGLEGQQLLVFSAPRIKRSPPWRLIFIMLPPLAPARGSIVERERGGGGGKEAGLGMYKNNSGGALCGLMIKHMPCARPSSWPHQGCRWVCRVTNGLGWVWPSPLHLSANRKWRHVEGWRPDRSLPANQTSTQTAYLSVEAIKENALLTSSYYQSQSS